jgi:apolipoprotein N-acyltransferase
VSGKRRDPGVIDLRERKKRERPPLFTRARALKTGIAVLSGVLLFLSCAHFDIWPFTWFAVAPLIALALDEKTTRPAYYGFVTGLFANGGGFYWIVTFLQRFGHLPLIAAIPIFLLLVSYQAITFSLFAWILRRLNDRFNIGVTFIAPTIYCALELVIPFVFPWYLAITQAWVRPVIQIAELTGPLGISFMILLTNGAIYDFYAARRKREPVPRKRLAVALGLVAFMLGFGAVRIHMVEAARAKASKVTVGVVQANIGIHEKWHIELAAQQLAVHQRLSRELEARGAELIVWPESSYPYVFRRDQTRDWPANDPQAAQRGFRTPLLFGTLTAGYGLPYPYNTALLLDRDGDIRGSFDKNILMVFGEYIPFYEQMKFIQNFIPETSNFARGSDVSVFPLDTPRGRINIGPMICYEDIFPSFVRRLVKHDPNVLVNITNDAWFGRTSEPYEHMALAVFRAVETRLDLVRALNTGASSFIDATGRVMQIGPVIDPDETPEAPPVTLLDQVAVLQPQKLYATLGEWFGGACLLATLLLGLRARALGGRPVRWRLVLAGAGTLVFLVVVLGGLFCGPLRLVWQLITHRPVSASVDTSFAVGVRLIPVTALACMMAGVVIAWLARASAERPRLESAIAVLLVLVAPATLLGTLEGEQAGLVIMALIAIGLTLLAGRLTRRYLRKASA